MPIPRLAATALLTAFVVSPDFLPAQAAPGWSTLSVAAPINPSSVRSLGKLIAYTNGTQVHVYSAFSRRWIAHPTGPNPALRIANDWLLVQDGTSWHAFAAASGRFATLTVSPQANVLNPAAQDNDSILLVADNGTVHAFSGFTGTWTSRAISGNAAVAVQRHVALLSDGNVLSGMDAFTGQWHDVATPLPITALTCDGTAGVGISATTWYGFSAIHRAWSTHPAFGGASRVRNDDWVLWHDGNQVAAFSGLQGRFATAIPGGPISVAASEDLFVVLNTALGYFPFSAITGAFPGPIAPAGAALRSSVSVAILVVGTTCIGYSPVRDSVVAIALDSSVEGVAGSVGYATGRSTGLPWLFSALTGQWHPAPGDVQPVTPMLTTTAVLLPTTTGVRAFSARTGAFVPLAGTGFVFEGNASSAIAAVWDANAFHAFDARTDHWRSQPRLGTGTPSLQVWRTELYAIDGNDVVGFGAQSGAWHTAPMPEPLVSSRANSESAMLTTNTHILGFSPIPEPCSLFQFPEFRRVFPAGATYRLQLRLPQGDVAFLGIGALAATPQVVAPFGTLWLDQVNMATAFQTPAAGEDRAFVNVPVPNAPALRGTEWFFQALVLPGNGNAYLTEASSVLVL